LSQPLTHRPIYIQHIYTTYFKGKTTLLRNIANGKIEGMPKELISVFVESHFDDEAFITTSTLDLLLEDPMLKKVSPNVIEKFLREELGFSDDMLKNPTSALSGGWRMKLALAR
jgi:elongation factor 3